MIFYNNKIVTALNNLLSGYRSTNILAIDLSDYLMPKTTYSYSLI